jgi:hypothetical protein
MDRALFVDLVLLSLGNAAINPLVNGKKLFYSVLSCVCRNIEVFWVVVKVIIIVKNQQYINPTVLNLALAVSRLCFSESKSH